ncbi:hypothetical protein DPMN_113235 [Dreissena polymorpha]|uniref:Uncharacterized protein n=1 Tax=Dreissena polymorpha TaxID=45954 RepID=A0A9D4KH64_DREPO|nr:hypothetical protein DPMN_113235 [Dreissena polymorpha]
MYSDSRSSCCSTVVVVVVAAVVVVVVTATTKYSSIGILQIVVVVNSCSSSSISNRSGSSSSSSIVVEVVALPQLRSRLDNIRQRAMDTIPALDLTSKCGRQIRNAPLGFIGENRSKHAPAYDGDNAIFLPANLLYDLATTAFRPVVASNNSCCSALYNIDLVVDGGGVRVCGGPVSSLCGGPTSSRGVPGSHHVTLEYSRICLLNVLWHWPIPLKEAAWLFVKDLVRW